MQTHRDHAKQGFICALSSSHNDSIYLYHCGRQRVSTRLFAGTGCPCLLRSDSTILLRYEHKGSHSLAQPLIAEMSSSRSTTKA